MVRRIHLTTIGVIALGSLLGYAAAAGSGNQAPKVKSEQREVISAVTQPAPAARKPAGCCNGLNKSAMVALAAQNEKVEVESRLSGKKPNICIIWGDDVGQSNISAYSHGLMGYHTPNIDRVAREGVMFTDY